MSNSRDESRVDSPISGSPWMLAFDCSSPRLVIALGTQRSSASEAQFIAGDSIDDAGRRASVELVPRIVALLATQQLELGDLGALACGRGPGTFTGTRVAVASAKGFCTGLGLPVHPLSTLSAIAASARTDTQRVIALLDARKGEVYAAEFSWHQGQLTRCSADTCVTLEAFMASRDVGAASPGTVGFVGPGAARYIDSLPADAGFDARLDGGPTPEGLWRVAVSASTTPAIPGQELSAQYLRVSYAEIGAHPPKRTPYRSPFVD